jgi:hypothetical protein
MRADLSFAQSQSCKAIGKPTPLAAPLLSFNPFHQPEEPIGEFVKSLLSPVFPILHCVVRRAEVFGKQTYYETIHF